MPRFRMFVNIPRPLLASRAACCRASLSGTVTHTHHLSASTHTAISPQLRSVHRFFSSSIGSSQATLPLRTHTRRLAAAANTGIIPGVPRNLDDVVKLELLESEPPARVAAIWEAYHQERDAVAGAAVPLSEHELLKHRAAESPLFIFPIRREGGHFLLFSQYHPPASMFAMTFLEDYRRNPELAPPWLSVTLFSDLVDSKQLGLMRAETDSSRLTTDEAEHMLMLVRRYYGGDAYDRVWTFNHSQRHFDLDAYLASCP